MPKKKVESVRDTPQLEKPDKKPRKKKEKPKQKLKRY